MDIEAVSLEFMQVITEDGTIGRIDHFLDSDGEETDDLEQVVVALVEWPDHTWSPVELQWEEATLH